MELCKNKFDLPLFFPKRYNKRGFGSTLKILNGKRGIIADSAIVRYFRKAGYFLDKEKDNKSVYEPSKLFERLQAYYPSESPRPVDDALLDKWVCAAYKVFGGKRDLLSISLSDEKAIWESIQLERSSGAPFFTKKRLSFHKDLALSKRISEFSCQPPPCISYHRVQHGKLGPKVRLVWGYPLSMTILEAKFARPLIHRFLKWRTPMAFGLHKHQLACRLIPIENSNVAIGMDFSQFDARIPSWLIHEAFSVLKTHFNFSKEDEACWKRVKYYFVNTSIVMPDGIVYTKSHGIPSGSYFTQMVGSICNFIITNYCYERATGYPIGWDKQLYLGDDSIFGIPHRVNLHELSNIALETFGSVIHPDKTNVAAKEDDQLHFLGHVFDHGIIDRDLRDLIIRYAFLERPIKTNDIRIYRRNKLFALSVDAKSGWKFYKLVKGRMSNNIQELMSNVFVNPNAAGYSEGRQASSQGTERVFHSTNLLYSHLLI